MVGPIKLLTDLRRIEAAVRVTCVDCGNVRMHDRELLIRDRLLNRQSLGWNAVCSSMLCWGGRCQSRRTRVEAIPFSQDDVVLRRKRGETIMINLALAVLKAAAHRPGSGAITTSEVRLALRVLHPYLKNQELLRAYWDVAALTNREAGTNCHHPLAAIVRQLVNHGYAVEAEFR